MKKKEIFLWLIALLICLTVLLFSYFNKYYGYCLEVYVNYDVLLSRPLDVSEIYRYEFGEGEDFYIFNYDNDKDIDKIIQKNDFEKITKKNLDEITKVLGIYRDDLCERELSLFDATTNISDLAKEGNYFLYDLDMELETDMKEDEHYFVEIIFPKEKKVYHFGINH